MKNGTVAQQKSIGKLITSQACLLDQAYKPKVGGAIPSCSTNLIVSTPRTDK